ncbi:4'-phosphopantetheinyl transferase superfamily protein [Streptomyces sp. SID5785]|uniref:4'-phosphopantetheinyl transferase family protein n=1 Tax=Streptomyces sp. SID5785 TaxID=2690309 RepID=UPI001361062E|nr:4'-phosphopantetheinyl transferase superfamily protein [Streptomyces sp. SID5785]MZD09809.1 4'-phosphopantetheinyl transferase superfamily protein [Streptomyces sp. SID5785]
MRELPRAGAARLWLVRTDTPAVDRDGVLDAAERRRAAAFHHDRHRERYVAAHLALRRVLGRVLELPPRDVRFVREPCPRCRALHGRPALRNEPGTHFSLSRAGDLALVAVAPVPVGADVEEILSAEATRTLATALHPRERAELAAARGESERTAGASRAWVRKEAYLKGLGTGLADGAAHDYVGTGPVPHGPGGWTLADVTVPRGWTAAVAVAPVPGPGARREAPEPRPSGAAAV